MYEAHYGLKSRPFGSKAEGAGVFSGPRQVETMTSIKKGLKALDAVVTVTGPVGVGKTSIVGRALDTISPNRMAAWVGRMQLAPDEVLQLLLAGFGIKRQANGTIQRFALFRRLLAERAAAGAPVAIVVEDAQRIGVDALAELEALTAADTGDGMSANIILMGQPELKKLLARPELARLNQRTRLRQAIEPLNEPEVNGYLRHCLRVAGGDYDRLFEAGAAEIVFSCSGGIPRMINTLCETALTTAMEDGLKTVSATLMHKVAVDAFGYEGPLPEAAPDIPSEESVEVPVIEIKVDPAKEAGSASGEPEIDWEAPAAQPDNAATGAGPEPAAADATADDEQDIPPSARDMIVESGHYPALPTESADSANDPEPAQDATSVDAEPEPEFEIPELINDTQPELSVLPPPKSDEAVVETLDLDTESTAIQEALNEDLLPEPNVGEPDRRPSTPAADIEPAPTPAAPPHAAASNDDDAEEQDAFDLDAALTFETEATNVMRGITANLEDVAQAPGDAYATVESTAAPTHEDLPTLTDSMKVDVRKEVGKARMLDSGPVAGSDSKADGPTKASPAKAADVAPQPIAKVSEMTARIAALDPSGRKNDVDAVEAALDAAKRGKMDELMAAPPLPQVSEGAPRKEEARAPIPEITLDDEIEKKQKAAAAKREKFAAEIGNANSLEEFSDAMAETLFGDEDFAAIAADVVANPPAEGRLVDGTTSRMNGGISEDPVAASAPDPVAVPQTGALNESRPSRVAGLHSPHASNDPPPSGPADVATPAPVAGNGNGMKPESIENQITTSMTQALEALNVSRVAESVAVESQEAEKPAKKGGLFSRFRRSS